MLQLCRLYNDGVSCNYILQIVCSGVTLNGDMIGVTLNGDMICTHVHVYIYTVNPQYTGMNNNRTLVIMAMYFETKYSETPIMRPLTGLPKSGLNCGLALL